jgi:hypothetical protein
MAVCTRPRPEADIAGPLPIYSAEKPGRANVAGNRNGLNVYSGRVAGS